jgi:hypothetical protein
MVRRVSQSYKFKLKLIKERESLMSLEELKNPKWFPNFIILAKPIIDGKDSESEDMDDEWKGIANEIKKVGKEVEKQMQNISKI